MSVISENKLIYRYLSAPSRPSQVKLRNMLLCSIPMWPESATLKGVAERWEGVAHGPDRSKGTLKRQIDVAIAYHVVARLGASYRYTRVDSEEQWLAATHWIPQPIRRYHRGTERCQIRLQDELDAANAYWTKQIMRRAFDPKASERDECD
jgi:hypothetical protein